MRHNTDHFHKRLILVFLFLLAFAVSAFGATSILSNPGFESGKDPWRFYTNGSGAFNNDVAGAGSSKAGHITISQPGTNVQLFQMGLPLQPNTKYTLSFKAYSNTGHDLSVFLHKYTSPYTNYGLSNQVFNLTTSWSTFTTTFTTSGFTGSVNDGELRFWLAPYDAAGDQYFIDDVVLSAVTTTGLPVITSQPVNNVVTAGLQATFSITATGATSYQWQKNGLNITGATSSTYKTPATTLADSGSTFKVKVSNSAGSLTSNTATLTVLSSSTKPSITTQPSNKTVGVGQTATFSIVATGTTPLTYQWQKNSTNISGATGASYTTPATILSDSGSTFRCVVSNSVGSVTSNAATLTVTSTTSNSFVLFDKTYYHNGTNRLYSDWDFVPRMAVQPDAPHNWVSPVNYRDGQYKLRVEVLEMEPVSSGVMIQFGWWNYYPDPETHHLASKGLVFSSPGVYEQIGNVKDIPCYFKGYVNGVLIDDNCKYDTGWQWDWTNAFADYYDSAHPEGMFYTLLNPLNNPASADGFPYKVHTTLTIFK